MPLSWKIGGGILAAVLLLFAVGELQRLHARSEMLADCQAIAGGELSRTKGDHCPAGVTAPLATARAATLCEQALGAIAGSPARWGAPPSCSAKTQNLVARLNVSLDAVDDRDRQLGDLRTGQAAAIARAEARGASQARSIANAKAALDAAPRDPDGLIRCDAGCLRQLAGEGS